MIEEFVVFSDFHAHEFPQGSSRQKYLSFDGFYNSRLIESCEVLEEISTYCKENNIRTVLFGGDLFHARGKVSTNVLQLISYELNILALLTDRIIMIPGNHDYADRKGNVHALYPFSHFDNIQVMDSVSVQDVGSGDYNVVAVPYTDSLEESKEALKKAGELADSKPTPSLLLAHLGMRGAKVGSDYVLVKDTDINSSDVPNEKFSACLFGHYHQHQKLFKNGWFIGATHHHTWGDLNTDRGFLHCKLDTETGEFSFDFIKSTAAREFRSVSYGGLKEASFGEKDHVRVTAVPSEKEEEVRKTLESQPFLDIQTIEENTEEEFVLDESTFDREGLIKAWVKHKKGKSDKNLQNLGIDLLNGVY